MTGHEPNQEPRKLAVHLAARLRELRARRQMTQDQVAKAVGCHESAVSRWEGGSRVPTAEDLVALSELFQVSCDYLLGKTEQAVAPGTALLDQRLLERLDSATTTEEFDRLVQENPEQAVWLPVPDGAVIVPVQEAMRRTGKVADRHKNSAFVDRLFRPHR